MRREKSTQEKVDAIASMIEPLLLKPEQIVLDYDQVSDSFYLIESGGCAFYSRRLSCLE